MLEWLGQLAAVADHLIGRGVGDVLQLAQSGAVPRALLPNACQKPSTAFALLQDGSLFRLLPASPSWDFIANVGRGYRSIAVNDGRLYGLREDSGVEVQDLAAAARDKWRLLRTGSDPMRSIAVKNGKVYAVGDLRFGDRVYCLTEEGTWKQASKGRCYSVSIYEDAVYVLGTNASVYKQGLSALTPFSSWRQAFPVSREIQSVAILCHGRALAVADARITVVNGEVGTENLPIPHLDFGNVTAVTTSTQQ